MVKNVFVSKIAVELIQCDLLLGGWLRGLQMDVRVLPCPPNLNQVLLVQSKPESESIAWALLQNDWRVSSSRWCLGLKAYAGSITEKRSKVKTQWFRWSLLLRREKR